MFRERRMGSLPSELGGYIGGFNRAPAGTKRLPERNPGKWFCYISDGFEERPLFPIKENELVCLYATVLAISRKALSGVANE